MVKKSLPPADVANPPNSKSCQLAHTGSDPHISNLWCRIWADCQRQLNTPAEIVDNKQYFEKQSFGGQSAMSLKGRESIVVNIRRLNHGSMSDKFISTPLGMDQLGTSLGKSLLQLLIFSAGKLAALKHIVALWYVNVVASQCWFCFVVNVQKFLKCIWNNLGILQGTKQTKTKHLTATRKQVFATVWGACVSYQVGLFRFHVVQCCWKRHTCHKLPSCKGICISVWAAQPHWFLDSFAQ